MFKKRSVYFFILVFFYEFSKIFSFTPGNFGDFIVIYLKKKASNLIS